MHVWVNRCYQPLLIGVLMTLMLWGLFPPTAHASLHTYHERPGQVTYRSRQSLRDYDDRAWQAIAFKRLQGETLQGLYLRLVGFPGIVQIDPQHPVVLLAATGQQWQLARALDPQTQSLPDSVGQYDLQPLLGNLNKALPLEMQIPLAGGTVAEVGIAPFVVKEWLQVKTASLSAPPIRPALRE